MPGCCERRKDAQITVILPSGETKPAASRPAAIAMVTRAGGGIIKGA